MSIKVKPSGKLIQTPTQRQESLNPYAKALAEGKLPEVKKLIKQKQNSNPPHGFHGSSQIRENSVRENKTTKPRTLASDFAATNTKGQEKEFNQALLTRIKESVANNQDARIYATKLAAKTGNKPAAFIDAVFQTHDFSLTDGSTKHPLIQAIARGNTDTALNICKAYRNSHYLSHQRITMIATGLNAYCKKSLEQINKHQSKIKEGDSEQEEMLETLTASHEKLIKNIADFYLEFMEENKSDSESLKDSSILLISNLTPVFRSIADQLPRNINSLSDINRIIEGRYSQTTYQHIAEGLEEDLAKVIENKDRSFMMQLATKSQEILDRHTADLCEHVSNSDISRIYIKLLPGIAETVEIDDISLDGLNAIKAVSLDAHEILVQRIIKEKSHTLNDDLEFITQHQAIAVMDDTDAAKLIKDLDNDFPFNFSLAQLAIDNEKPEAAKAFITRTIADIPEEKLTANDFNLILSLFKADSQKTEFKKLLGTAISRLDDDAKANIDTSDVIAVATIADNLAVKLIREATNAKTQITGHYQRHIHPQIPSVYVAESAIGLLRHLGAIKTIKKLIGDVNYSANRFDEKYLAQLNKDLRAGKVVAGKKQELIDDYLREQFFLAKV